MKCNGNLSHLGIKTAKYILRWQTELLTGPTNLIEPVWINNPETSQFSTSTLLSNRSLAALELQLGDTLVCGLAIDNTLGNRPLTTTPPNTDTINHITLGKECTICQMQTFEKNVHAYIQWNWFNLEKRKSKLWTDNATISLNHESENPTLYTLFILELKNT